jgi:hypothetical protein
MRWKEGLSAPAKLFAYLAKLTSDALRRVLKVVGLALVVILAVVVALTVLVATGHGGELILLVQSVRG